MEPLFAIILFGVAALLSAVLKRKQRPDQDKDAWPDSRGPGRSEAQSSEGRVSWEDELRRLLAGEATKAPPPPLPPSPPPPVVRDQPRRPPARPTAPVRTAPATTPRRPLHTWHARPEHKSPELTGLHESTTAYEHAAHLDSQAKAQLQQAADQVSHIRTSPTVVRPQRDLSNALDLFRSHKNLRAAIIASVVLGKPKAME